MHHLRSFFSALGPIVVIGSLMAFVFYSLVIYDPADRLACNANFIARQADIAVHVIRQWSGKEGQEYAGCYTGLKP